METFAIFVAISCCVWAGIALLIAIARAMVRPLPRFSLRSLFLITAVIAVYSYCIYWCNHAYYWQLYDVRDVLAEHPEIDKVWLGTNNDADLEVEQVYFSIQGQPDVTYDAHRVDGQDKREFRKHLERALQERKPVVRPDWVVEYGIR